jgi:hypothetical protein
MALPEKKPRQIARVRKARIESKGDRDARLARQRHSRKCQVCHHPCRDVIEFAFVNWRKPLGISQIYKISGDSLYRHAHALDLYTRRRNNLRSALDNILERGVETPITGETALGAIRAYTCLTEENKWIEPSSNVIFSHQPQQASQQTANATLSALAETARTIDVEVESVEPRRQFLPSGGAKPVSNRNSQELAIDVTY